MSRIDLLPNEAIILRDSEMKHDRGGRFSEHRVSMQAYEESSQRASNIAAQQKIAQGIQDNGLGDGGGMLFGMNLAQDLTARGEGATGAPPLSLNEQIEAVKQLKELLDGGVLSQEEFEAKKREIMGL